MNINLKEKSLIELKAIAYDLLSMQQNIANNLAVVNKELEAKAQEELKAQENLADNKLKIEEN